ADGLVDQLTSEIQSLQAEQRAQTFQREVLTQKVEQAKTARTTLETKVQEGSIAAATGGGKAIIVAGASGPTAPSSPPPLTRTLPAAALVGLLIGAALAVLREFVDRNRTVERAVDPGLTTREAASVGR